MIRKYALVIFDKFDNIIDRYNLDLITNPQGNGFELNMNVISTDVEDAITKISQKKSKITMNVLQVRNPYEKSNSLSTWIQKYSNVDDYMFLEYNDTKVVKYCGGKVTKLTKTELTEYKELSQQLEFTMTTPFFVRISQKITISQIHNGKSYPYKYPYSYGGKVINNNNEIVNPYIKDVPLVVTITGGAINPSIIISNEKDGRYGYVRIETIIRDKEKIVINSANKKIIKIAENGDETDIFSNIDPRYDAFILAKNGVSTIGISSDNNNDNYGLSGSWRQYVL